MNAKHLRALCELRTIAAEAHAAVVLRQQEHDAVQRFYLRFQPIHVLSILDELLLELVEEPPPWVARTVKEWETAGQNLRDVGQTEAADAYFDCAAQLRSKGGL